MKPMFCIMTMILELTDRQKWDKVLQPIWEEFQQIGIVHSDYNYDDCNEKYFIGDG